MSRRRNQGRKFLDTMSLSGWLFADLMLGLAMLFFAFNTVGSNEQPLPTATPTPTVLPTPVPSATVLPTSTATPTPEATATATVAPTPTTQSGLSQQPVTELITADADRLLGPDGASKDAERMRIRSFIRERFGRFDGQQRAGIVLTFGTAPIPAEGRRLAIEMNQLLAAELPGVFHSGGDQATVFRDFHFISRELSQRGNIDMEVYLLLGSS